MKIDEAFKRINDIIYAQGVILGSDEYFEIRSICCDKISELNEDLEEVIVDKSKMETIEKGAQLIRKKKWKQ